MENGIPLSLQDIWDAVGLSLPMDWTTPSYNVTQTGFDDGCGEVQVGLWVDATVGTLRGQAGYTAIQTDAPRAASDFE